MKNWIAGALVAVLAVSAAVGIAIAQEEPPDSEPGTANVEVRVWQSTRDAESLYISARPEGGSWAALGTIPLDMSGLNSRGTFRYGDITVGVPVGASTERDIADTRGCAEALEYETDFRELRFITCYSVPAELGDKFQGVLTWNGVESDYEGWFYEGVTITWQARARDTERICLAFSEWVTTNYTVSRVFSCSVDGSLYNYEYEEQVWIATGKLLGNDGNEYLFDARLLDSTVLSATFYKREKVLNYYAD